MLALTWCLIYCIPISIHGRVRFVLRSNYTLRLIIFSLLLCKVKQNHSSAKRKRCGRVFSWTENYFPATIKTMALYDSLCFDEFKFNITLSVIFIGMFSLIIIAVISTTVLCIDDRQRRKRFKTKHDKYNARRKQNVEEVNRALTYLGYMQNVGCLNSKEHIKPPNVKQLVDDPDLAFERKISVDILNVFFGVNPIDVSNAIVWKG